MKDQYLLNNNIIFLNHGSFGACPKPVFNKYQQWQLLIENQPVQYFSNDIYNYLNKSRKDLSTFISCDADDIIFIQNPTIAINKREEMIVAFMILIISHSLVNLYMPLYKPNIKKMPWY